MENNPILHRATRGRPWHRDRRLQRMILIGGGIAALPSLAALLLDPLQASPLAIIPFAALALSLLLVVCNPLMVMALTTVLILNQAAREDFPTLRLVGLSTFRIAQGYTAVAAYRLRYWWVMSLWLVPAAAISLIHLTVHSRAIQYARYTHETLLDSVGLSIPLGIFVVAVAVRLSIPACKLGMLIGTYFAVRWMESAVFISSALGLSGMILLLILVSVIVQSSVVAYAAAVIGLVLVPLMNALVPRLTGRGLEHAIELRSQVGG